MASSLESISGKLAVVSGKGMGLINDLASTFKEHTAVLRPFMDICAESLAACYPDLYGDDASMKGKKFDLVAMLEKGEIDEDMEPALLESVSTIGQLVDYFIHMKKKGLGIDESDFSACTADQAGLLSAIAIAASASDSEFGVNASKAIRASFYAGLARDSSVAQQWTEKGISLPNLRMPLLAGDDHDDVQDLRGLPDLTSKVADILSKEECSTNWAKAYCTSKSKGLVRFGTDKHAKEVLLESISAAGGEAQEWQVEAAGSGGVMWDSIGITKSNEQRLIQELRKNPCGVWVTEVLNKFNSPGDLLKEMQLVEARRQANRAPWQWSDVNWVMVVFFSLMHVFAVTAVFYSWNHPQFYSLWLLTIVTYMTTGALGITGGAHRMWAHKSYKAHFPARLVMMVMNSIANQGSIFHWSRDHRVHHAKSDTEADPHDITRGFFYSHMGWLLLKKSKAVKEAGKKINCDDLLADPLVAIQHYCDPWWNQFFCFGLPAIYGWYVYDDALLGFLVLGAARWLLCLHATWTVNSVAHTFGTRPYEPNMYPTESWFTTFVAVGEGYHNWHHTYPYDYCASEGGLFDCYNPTTVWIDFLALIGQAYGLRRAKHNKPKFE